MLSYVDFRDETWGPAGKLFRLYIYLEVMPLPEAAWVWLHCVNTNTLFVSAMNTKYYEKRNSQKKKKGLIDCDKCICAYPSELWALFVFLFTALTHALVPAWLTSSCVFPSSGTNAQKIHTKEDKLSEL